MRPLFYLSAKRALAKAGKYARLMEKVRKSPKAVVVSTSIETYASGHIKVQSLAAHHLKYGLPEGKALTVECSQLQHEQSQGLQDFSEFVGDSPILYFNRGVYIAPWLKACKQHDLKAPKFPFELDLLFMMRFALPQLSHFGQLAEHYHFPTDGAILTLETPEGRANILTYLYKHLSQDFALQHAAEREKAVVQQRAELEKDEIQRRVSKHLEETPHDVLAFTPR